MNWKSVNHRSVLLLQLVIIALYCPIPVSSISIIIFLLHSFFNRNFFRNIRSHPHKGWVLLALSFFAINAISLLYSENLPDGLRRLETLQPFLWLPLIMASIDIGVLRERRYTLINTFFWASILAALVAIGTAVFHIVSTGSLYAPVNDDGIVVKEYYFTYLRLSRIIMHPGYLSLYMGIAIYLGYGLIREQKLWFFSRRVGYGLLAFLLVFLFMLQGRMNLLAFGAITFIALVVFLFRRAKPVRALAFSAITIASLSVLFFVLPNDVTQRFTEFQSLNYQMDAPVIHQFNGITIRLAEWHCAWDVIRENILGGVGLGDAHDRLMSSYRENNFVVGLAREFNCHNQYLESWLGAGLPAVLVLLLLLMYALLQAYRQKNALLAMVVLYFFFSMLTESMLIRHKAVTLFNSLLTLLVFINGFNHKQQAVKEAEE